MPKNSKNKKFISFGEHLTLDGYGGDPKKLNDKKIVMRFISDLPKKINMRILGKPVLYWANEGHIKDPGGWSGFVVVVESHISIHTFPKRCFVSADVYTCNAEGMDKKFVEKYFKKLFDISDIEVGHIKRGTRYPSCDIH
jgi:S-adenosylmethionine decarboxylase